MLNQSPEKDQKSSSDCYFFLLKLPNFRTICIVYVRVLAYLYKRNHCFILLRSLLEENNKQTKS